MRKVVSRQDALMKAYDAGLLIGNGTFKVEGIGDRSTNWGRGMTLTINDATLSEAKVAVGWFADVVNKDARNWRRNGDCLTLRLTTFGEGRQFASRIGIEGRVEKAVADVTRHDKETRAKARYVENGGRLCEGTTCETFSLKEQELEALVAVCSGLMEEPPVKEWSEEAGWHAVEGLLMNAFQEGKRGFALGGSDVEALRAGEGILDRYDVA